MTLASSEEIDRFLADHPDWESTGKEISRTFTFDDFNGSLGFVNRVAERAEVADHHPDIDIRWNRVTLSLSTHSEGGLTRKDFALASEADALA